MVCVCRGSTGCSIRLFSAEGYGISLKLLVGCGMAKCGGMRDCHIFRGGIRDKAIFFGGMRDAKRKSGIIFYFLYIIKNKCTKMQGMPSAAKYLITSNESGERKGGQGLTVNVLHAFFL